jgi:hypothetical protein
VTSMSSTGSAITDCFLTWVDILEETEKSKVGGGKGRMHRPTGKHEHKPD